MPRPSLSTQVGRSAPDGPPPTELIELPRDDCLELLKTQSFGRLAVSFGKGPPVIRPVNYAFDEASQSIVFRTADGSKFHALLQSAQAAFEVDHVDGASHTGWSVIVTGVTDVVTHPSELRRLDNLGLEPWAPGRKAHWVHIRAWTVSGRRIVPARHRVPRDQG